MKVAATKRSNKQKESSAAANSISQKEKGQKRTMGFAYNSHGLAAGRRTNIPNRPAQNSQLQRFEPHSPSMSNVETQPRTRTKLRPRFSTNVIQRANIELSHRKSLKEIRTQIKRSLAEKLNALESYTYKDIGRIPITIDNQIHIYPYFGAIADRIIKVSKKDLDSWATTDKDKFYNKMQYHANYVYDQLKTKSIKKALKIAKNLAGLERLSHTHGDTEYIIPEDIVRHICLNYNTKVDTVKEALCNIARQKGGNGIKMWKTGGKGVKAKYTIEFKLQAMGKDRLYRRNWKKTDGAVTFGWPEKGEKK
jgi:hypothetical protein